MALPPNYIPSRDRFPPPATRLPRHVAPCGLKPGVRSGARWRAASSRQGPNLESQGSSPSTLQQAAARHSPAELRASPTPHVPYVCVQVPTLHGALQELCYLAPRPYPSSHQGPKPHFPSTPSVPIAFSEPIRPATIDPTSEACEARRSLAPLAPAKTLAPSSRPGPKPYFPSTPSVPLACSEPTCRQTRCRGKKVACAPGDAVPDSMPIDGG